MRTTWISKAQESIPLRIMPQPMLILNGDMSMKDHMLRACGLDDHTSSKESNLFGLRGSSVGLRDHKPFATLRRDDNKHIW